MPSSANLCPFPGSWVSLQASQPPPEPGKRRARARRQARSSAAHCTALLAVTFQRRKSCCTINPLRQRDRRQRTDGCEAAAAASSPPHARRARPSVRHSRRARVLGSGLRVSARRRAAATKAIGVRAGRRFGRAAFESRALARTLPQTVLTSRARAFPSLTHATDMMLSRVTLQTSSKIAATLSVDSLTHST